MTFTEEEKAICLKAAQVVRKGWCQGHFAFDGDKPLDYPHCFATCFCARGALYVVAGSGIGRCIARKIQDLLGKPLEQWNDAPERTQDEVVALLEGVAHA